MKPINFLSFLLALCLFAPASAQQLKGDVNEDGAVDISDVVAVINIIAFGQPQNPDNPDTSDPAVKAGFCKDKKHPHIIDMGKAGKWACCNVGASAPWEFGGYYAWGESEEKDYYDWNTYIHCDGDESSCDSIGVIAGTEYDVAHVKWGNGWKLPSNYQFFLLSKCKTEKYSLNGIAGIKFTSDNGNSLFFPIAGFRWDSELNDVYTEDVIKNSTIYWSSTQDGMYDPNFINDEGGVPDKDDSLKIFAFCFQVFNGGELNCDDSVFRTIGCSVRPVTE